VSGLKLPGDCGAEGLSGVDGPPSRYGSTRTTRREVAGEGASATHGLPFRLESVRQPRPSIDFGVVKDQSQKQAGEGARPT